MPTPESWQGEAERLSRYAQSQDEGFVTGRLRTDPRFRAGWNSALWEVHQLLLDDIDLDPELLMDMAAR